MNGEIELQTKCGVWVPIDTPEADTDTYTPDAHRTNADQSELEKYLMVKGELHGPWACAVHSPMYKVTDNVVQNADPNNQCAVVRGRHGDKERGREQSMVWRWALRSRLGTLDNDDENQLTYRLSWAGCRDLLDKRRHRADQYEEPEPVELRGQDGLQRDGYGPGPVLGPDGPGEGCGDQRLHRRDYHGDQRGRKAELCDEGGVRAG